MESSTSTSSTSEANVVTYRFQNALVYVKPETDYEVAVDVARSEYADLSNVPRERIMFTVQASMNGTRQPVRISRSAWAATMSRMMRGEVIDIALHQDKSQPPHYLEVPEKDSYYDSKSPSRASSPMPSRPMSRASSPTPSSRGSQKSWFKKLGT